MKIRRTYRHLCVLLLISSVALALAVGSLEQINHEKSKLMRMHDNNRNLSQDSDNAFQILSDHPNDGSVRYCITAKSQSFKNKSRLVVKPCVNDDSLKWFVDEEGKIRNKKYKNKCIQTKGRRTIQIMLCNDQRTSQMFAFNVFDNTLFPKINGLSVFGLLGDTISSGDIVKVLPRDITSYGQNWHLEYDTTPTTSLSIGKTIFERNEDIVITFTNSEATTSSWIAIYPSGQDPNALPSSSVWVYAACSSTVCDEASTSGVVTFGENHDHGGTAWPLCPGEWQAFIINDITNPYESLAYSSTFIVNGKSCCTLASTPASELSHAVPVNGEQVSKIGFSSCYKPASQTSSALWDHVRDTFQADIWSWLGDNTYSDGTSMEYKRTQYNKGKEDNFYSSIGPIALPKIPVTGTWDDHDSSTNNQGEHYECFKESQDEFTKFFDIPSTDPRHPDQGINQQKGVYSSYMFSMPGGGNGIHLIHVDARYHRSPTYASYGPCEGSASSMLGDDQWIWLQSELNRKSEVKIIGSGIQVLPPTYYGRSLEEYCAYDEEGGTFVAANSAVGENQEWSGHGYECWSEIPQERTKLLKMCQKSINDGNAKKIIFISGDQHWGEIMAKKMPADNAAGDSQIIYEVTASGIDQNWPYSVDNSNRLRIRSADNDGDGIYNNECNFPFVYEGVTYNDCTPYNGKEWCATVTDENNAYEGTWGYCAPISDELVPRSSISYSGQHICTDNYLHICSANANYGGVSVDWESNVIKLSVFTPHESESVAAEIKINL